MKSQRSLRSITSHFKPKHSNSPTLTSTYSEKAFWTKSYKNQPCPKELKRILIGHKFKFSDFSDQEEDTSGVVVEEEEVEVLKKKKILPKVTIMSDRGEFCDSRSRIKSERKPRRGSSRSKSVESLKLPQVMQEKKEEDQLQKPERSRLSEVKDKNEFNQCMSRASENNSITQVSKDSHEPNHFSTAMPERIIQNEAEETKSENLKRDNKSVYFFVYISFSSELEKIIVDEVDDKKWKKDESQQQISEIIEQEKQDEENENINNLRLSLEKLEHQTEYLNKSKEEQLRVATHRSDHAQDSKEDTKLKEQAYSEQKVIKEEEATDN